MVRAIGREPTAEVRGDRLMSHGRAVVVSSPYLFPAAADAPTQPVSDGSSPTDIVDRTAVARGQADALGLLLRHSDLDVHRQLRPDEPLPRLIFDIAEQLRCEALAPPLPGLRANIDSAFQHWCLEARRQRVSELGVALLIYTVTHMLRSRLTRSFPDETVDDILEATRANISPIVGASIAAMVASVGDQRHFAMHARELADLVAEIAGDATTRELDVIDPNQYRVIVPVEPADSDAFDAVERDETDTSDGPGLAPVSAHDRFDSGDMAALGGYRVFTTRYDVERTGQELYPEPIRRALRRQLDSLIASHAVSSYRLAQMFRHHFGAPVPDGWNNGEPDGLIDPARLSQLLANPERQQVFRQPRQAVHANTAITFLLDNSGSMKVQRFEALAMLVDTCVRALDLAGVTSEVLGFTTAAWSGGQAQQDWIGTGMLPMPGRLNETLHIVYKDADTSWRRARNSLASMLRPMHFRESVDGEALIWAHQRLMTRPEPRRLLVMVSDGAPTDSATANANSDTYLANHLGLVVDRIERRSPVELRALTLDGDMGAVFVGSLPIELDDTLTLRTFSVLTQLFA